MEFPWHCDDEIVSTSEDLIHGQVQDLPEGYALRKLPSNVSVSPQYAGGTPQLCNTHNMNQLTAITQLLFTIFMLHRIRGDQIAKYGYASFGLTVIPYAIMSFINLLANVLTPDYSSYCLVRSEVLKEAKRRGKFNGTVGALEEIRGISLQFEVNDQKVEGNAEIQVSFRDPGNLSKAPGETKPEVIIQTLGQYKTKPSTTPKRIFRYSLGYSVSSRSLLPMQLLEGGGGLTPARVVHHQRGWLMAWLVCGRILGLFWELFYTLLKVGQRCGWEWW